MLKSATKKISPNNQYKEIEELRENLNRNNLGSVTTMCIAIKIEGRVWAVTTKTVECLGCAAATGISTVLLPLLYEYISG